MMKTERKMHTARIELNQVLSFQTQSGHLIFKELKTPQHQEQSFCS
jgi:hypothetical protein